MHPNANVSQLQQRLTQQRMVVPQPGGPGAPMQMQPRPGMVRVRVIILGLIIIFNM